ncbi:MAG: ParM/StbA family protein [Firmicutes bacterium]|nr:ParM/StbA family protein [Bacillota bacterium]
MLRGIDKGTTYTKDNLGNILKSTIKEVKDEALLDGKTIVEYECKKYIVGEKGNYSTDLEKANHKNTKIMVYTMLAIGSMEKYITTNLVLGLPIGLYSNHKEKMKNLFKNDFANITVNDKEKFIKITGIEVFPEAAGAYYNQPHRNCLIIDLGGLSIDTADFENGKLIKHSTYSMGTMKLYSKIANRLNSIYDLNFTEWNIPRVFDEGLYIYGERQDLDVDDILESHTLEIIERLKLEYDLKAYKNICLTGGGSILLESYLKRYMPQCEPIESIFANARGFYNVGKVIFNEQG